MEILVNKPTGARARALLPLLAKSFGVALCALYLSLCGAANASEEDADLQTCQQKAGKDMGAKCLELLAQELKARSTAPSTHAQTEPKQETTGDHSYAQRGAPQNTTDKKLKCKNTKDSPYQVLDTEWPQDQEERVNSYRQNYVLVSHSSRPNSAPTSPNPNNRVPFSYQPDSNDMKFQFSLKARIGQPWKNGTFWFGYTQQSFWQIFDPAHSRPFRESNYEPELIYSHMLEPATWLSPRILNIGLVHQSNGQSDPRSRSWNRAYIQGGWENDQAGGGKLVVLPRLWGRLDRGSPVDDNNPDITHYLGYGDIEVRYYVDKQFLNGPVLSALARSRSLQFDVAMRFDSNSDLDLHFQHFRGYGESMIDYNQWHYTNGLGLSMHF